MNLLVNSVDNPTDTEIEGNHFFANDNIDGNESQEIRNSSVNKTGEDGGIEPSNNLLDEASNIDEDLQDVLTTGLWTNAVLNVHYNYAIEGESLEIYFEDNSNHFLDDHLDYMESIISEIDDVIDLDFVVTRDQLDSDIQVLLFDRGAEDYLGQATAFIDHIELQVLWDVAEPSNSNLNTFTHEFMHALGIGEPGDDGRWDQDITAMSYRRGDSIDWRSSPSENDFEALVRLWGEEDDLGDFLAEDVSVTPSTIHASSDISKGVGGGGSSAASGGGENNAASDGVTSALDELIVIQPEPVPDGRPKPVVASSRIEVPEVFSEGFDAVTGFNENVDLASQVARLYLAAFARFGEFEGLKHWFDTAKAVDITNIAGKFVESQEFSDTYGELTNLEFVGELYNNVLGRSGDSGGTQFWVNQLDTNTLSRAEILVGFSESSENQALFNSLF